jgi:hypothetical protein
MEIVMVAVVTEEVSIDTALPGEIVMAAEEVVIDTDPQVVVEEEEEEVVGDSEIMVAAWETDCMTSIGTFRSFPSLKRISTLNILMFVSAPLLMLNPGDVLITLPFKAMVSQRYSLTMSCLLLLIYLTFLLVISLCTPSRKLPCLSMFFAKSSSKDLILVRITC